MFEMFIKYFILKIDYKIINLNSSKMNSFCDFFYFEENNELF